METVKESSESMERDDEPFPSVTVSMSPPSVPFSLLTSSEARARGAVERDPKDEPRSGEDKGRVTRGLGVNRERIDRPGRVNMIPVSRASLGLSAPYLVSLPHLLRIPFGSPPE